MISKPSSRIVPLIPRSPSPLMICRSERSFMSIARFHVTSRALSGGSSRWCRWLSIAAASRLWADAIACRSPVKCRLISSIGSTCDQPPPAAPPFIPMHGPSDGSRIAIITRRPVCASPWPSPIVIVVLPSPCGVGVIAVTSTSRPSGCPASRRPSAGSTLAMWRP